MQHHSSISQAKFVNLHKGITNTKSFFLLGDCLNGGKEPKQIENAVNFLTHQAFKSTEILSSAGSLVMNAEEQAAKVNSTCKRSLPNAQNDALYVQAYNCEINVQNVCYDYVQKLRFLSK